MTQQDCVLAICAGQNERMLFFYIADDCLLILIAVFAGFRQQGSCNKKIFLLCSGELVLAAVPAGWLIAYCSLTLSGLPADNS